MAHRVTESAYDLSTPTEMLKDSSEWFWKIHWMVFAVVFSIIGCYAMVLFTQAVRRGQELTRSYRVSVFALIITLCFSRMLYLLLNPYEVGQALLPDTPVAVVRLTYGLGQPSLTAGFGLVHASFLNVAKIRQYHHEPLLKTKTILVIIGLYFFFGMMTEIIAIVYPELDTMLAVSCVFAVVGCTIVTFTVTYSGVRILRKATENKSVLTKGAIPVSASTEQLGRAKSVAKVAKVTLAAALFCVGLTITNGIAFVKMLNQMSSVTQWENLSQFIAYVTSVRLLEIAMACTLIYAISRSAAVTATKMTLFRRLTRKFSKSREQPAKSFDDVIRQSSSWKISSFSSQNDFVTDR